MNDFSTQNDPEPDAPERTLADIYVNGVVGSDDVPPGCPVLTCGSAHNIAVPRLVAALNDHLGLELPSGNAVTPEILRAVQTLRQNHNVPPEQGLMPPESFIGPNTWAAIAFLDESTRTAA